MKIEYRITKSEDKILPKMGKEGWQLLSISDGKMYWSKKIPVNRKTPFKAVEELRYNKTVVRGLCPYAFDKDFQELYEEWREKRKLSKSYKNAFDESSEKRVFNKLNKVTKRIGIEMLDNAIESKWLTLYPLGEKEKEKILVDLNNTKRKEEDKREGFSTDEEKKQAEDLKSRIDEYIETHPELKEESRNYVLEKHPDLRVDLQEKMIQTRCAMMANNIINK